MTTATDWRSALCLAIFVRFASPLRAAPAAPERAQQGFIAQGDDIALTARRNLVDPRLAARNEAGVAEALNAADRAAQQEAQIATMALASNDEPAPAASDQYSIRHETSLIGKILIGIGTLLTLASAARMLAA